MGCGGDEDFDYYNDLYIMTTRSLSAFLFFLSAHVVTTLSLFVCLPAHVGGKNEQKHDLHYCKNKSCAASYHND